MKKKNAAAIVAASILVMGLTGCGENRIPDMTEAQMEEVGEYVAFTMMKYDANHRSRLVSLEELEAKPTLPPATPEPTKEPQGMGKTDNTPVRDASSGTAEYTLEEVMGLPEGMKVNYTGFSLCREYPEDGENGFFALNAAEGKELLVLKLEIVNNSSQEQRLDVLSSGEVFRVTVNGNYTRRALTTILVNDLSTFVGSVPASEKTDVVLLIEVDEENAGALNSISLSVKSDTGSCRIPLL